MATKLQVSVIIPSFNRRKELEKCLNSVLRQNFNDFEVIVVDDGSTDRTSEMLHAKFNKLKVLKNDENLGVSKAKNRAILESKSKYLWFLDSDTEIINSNTLKFMFDYLQSDDTVGSLGCELIIRGGKWLIREHAFFDIDKTYPFDQKGFSKPVAYLATCNCFTRRNLVEKIGGFNEKYFYGYEDAELGKKISDLGYKNVINSAVAVFHYRTAKTRTANYQLFFKNRIRFCLWNFPVGQLVKLPFIDIKNFFFGIMIAKTTAKHEIKGQSTTLINSLFGKLGIVFEYFYGLFYGYLWNFIHLPKTLLLDRPKNYLE